MWWHSPLFSGCQTLFAKLRQGEGRHGYRYLRFSAVAAQPAVRSDDSEDALSKPNRLGQSCHLYYRLLCVAVLLVIFQVPLIRSRLWKSIHPCAGSAAASKLSWTEAASPTCVTETNRPTIPRPGGIAHFSKSSEIGF